MKSNQNILQKGLLRYVIQQLIYSSRIHEKIISKDLDELEICDLKDKVQRAKRILVEPNNVRLNIALPPRGWANDLPTGTDAELDNLYAILRDELNKPIATSVEDLMINRIASNVISEVVFKNGLDVEDFWRQVRVRVDKALISVD
jgi:hypothetical protein